MIAVHHEKNLENYIVSKLEQQGWLVGKTDHYDTEHALYPEDLVAWLKDTQPGKWQKLEKANGTGTTDALMTRLSEALEEHGTVQVLRRGFPIAGCGNLDMSESAPEDARNKKGTINYAANRLRVVPQLKYHPAREFAIDLCFFINGIPVATVEVKTDFTQAVEDAKEQYKKDRIPFDPKTRRREPLLTFKRGAVVHFAMSDSEIWMATKLDGQNTTFLPFNQGNKGHAGNPARADGEYPVAYFWEAVCQRDAWLRIFHSFVYVEKRDVVDIKGNWSKKETQIFPRFHQWVAVNKMITDAKKLGPGHPYLCEHSAGSGKTSTIAWTAHDLVKLRKPDGTPIFNSVVIVTDRNVLDSQLQDAVKQIDHQMGLIAAIDRVHSSKSKSKQLAAAFSAGTPIIVVTIQTFPHAMEAILTEKSLRDKNFAVIIDEAHASQTGTAASKLQAVLAMKSKDAMASMTVEELLEHIQKSRVRPRNVSHFAFTATPKHSTLMLFGRPPDPSRPAGKNNLPASFDKYPMRQAIEEKFILDVLIGYTPYKTAFNLSENILDQKRVDSRQAKRALARWMNLHATNVTQKVEFIVEHFAINVEHMMNGNAKAMVVTSSRAAAVRYKLAFDKYIGAHPKHQGIRTLVAFSGKLTGKEVIHAQDPSFKDDTFVVAEDAEFSEATMNIDLPNSDLRLAFDRPEYRVMVVADKFQTGFDQPKLVAMYIDKKIANEVEIVQTFSRLNRPAAGKDQTFIIDFVNNPESVLEAFRKYDDGAQIEDVQNPNVVYTIKRRLDDAGLYGTSHLDAFREARFKTIREMTSAKEPQHKALYAATQEPTDRYNAQVKMLRNASQTEESAFEAAIARNDKRAAKAADQRRKEYDQQIKTLMDFKDGLGKFCRTYAYVAQLIDFGDPELENFAAFARLLSKRLDGVTPDNIDLAGLVLTGWGIQQQPVVINPENEGEDAILHPTGPGGGGLAPQPAFLREIISRLNALFGETTPIVDQASFVNQIASIARENNTVMAQVENNSREDALRGTLPGAVADAVVRALTSHQALASLVLKQDRQSMGALTDLIYDLLKEQQNIDVESLNA